MSSNAPHFSASQAVPRSMRISHQASVELYASDWSVTYGRLRDISRTGLYLHLDPGRGTVPLLATEVAVKLIVERGESSLAVEAQAEVVRVESGGLALGFRRPLCWWPAFVVFPERLVKKRGGQHPTTTAVN
jgi:hypothetical protein